MTILKFVCLFISAVLPVCGHAAPAGLQDVHGKPVAVADLHRKGPAVLWFTNLCDNCQGGFSAMDGVVRALAGTNATVTAVSFIKNDRERVLGLIKNRQPAFPILLDVAGTVTQQFTGAKPANACPLTNLVILDRQGTVVFRGHYPGVAPDDLLRRVREATKAR